MRDMCATSGLDGAGTGALAVAIRVRVGAA
ncbi:hypothetical protein BJ996_005297 [Streptomyces phaeogriseichromatogenes]|nr:hypothetical protein [Streptomyces murinus]